MLVFLLQIIGKKVIPKSKTHVHKHDWIQFIFFENIIVIIKAYKTLFYLFNAAQQKKTTTKKRLKY